MNPIYKGLIGLGITIALVVLFQLYITAQYDKGHKAGKDECEAAQAKEQVKHTNKVKRGYDAIDNKTPNSSDIAAVDKFLLEHTTGNGSQ